MGGKITSMVKKRSHLRDLRQVILEEPWEQALLRQERWVARWIIWPFVAFAVAYFMFVAINVIGRQ